MRDHPSRSAAVVAMAKKIGRAPRTLHEWLKQAEVAPRRLPSDNASHRRNVVGPLRAGYAAYMALPVAARAGLVNYHGRPV
ncbi:hypothetical protein [Sphingomonas sp. CFBP 8760]|uniref:hypothetical protein n=1 Tax=Sphingomonas sp. CFBP 8760 TaxID=2775282 RepID=UPI001781D14F|nr:hypothetical protein [Sphingomonas sp. CFBP 8760]MBD8547993.1 hypothetical protein [Sphingomonas sp. CFBP 8760]